MANTWQEELKNETYTVGAPETLGETQWGWDEHYEVHFANGAIALIDCHRDQIQAVKVPGKRGYRLHVNGQTHYKKWSKFSRGAGIAWTGRKGWNTIDCPWRVWQYCKSTPYQRASQ